MSTTLAVYLHNIDPYAIKLWDGGPIRWYGVAYLIGFVVGYWIIRRIVRVGISPLRLDQISSLVIAIAVGVMIGGRLGYVLLYDQALFWTFTDHFPFWGLLALNRGGMASHGGLIGMILAALYFARRNEISFVHLLDLTTFASPIGLFFGRITNFVNGELYGRKCNINFPLAVKFPQEMLTQQWNDNYESALLPQLASILPPKLPSHLFRDWAIEQIQQGNMHVARIVEPLLTPRHPSQLYQAVLEGLLVFVLVSLVWIKARKSGVIAGLCCGFYSVMRIIGEIFREPDEQLAHLEASTFGITRGQWLSGILLIASIAIIIICSKLNVERLGGWRQRTTSQLHKSAQDHYANRA